MFQEQINHTSTPDMVDYIDEATPIDTTTDETTPIETTPIETTPIETTY